MPQKRRYCSSEPNVLDADFLFELQEWLLFLLGKSEKAFKAWRYCLVSYF